jgi:hypothetical protein
VYIAKTFEGPVDLVLLRATDDDLGAVLESGFSDREANYRGPAED